MPKKKAASAPRPPHPQIICPYCYRRFCYGERGSAPVAPQRPAPSLPEPEEAGEEAAKKSTSPSPQRTRSSTVAPQRPAPSLPKPEEAGEEAAKKSTSPSPKRTRSSTPPPNRPPPSRPSSSSTGRRRRRSRRKKKRTN